MEKTKIYHEVEGGNGHMTATIWLSDNNLSNILNAPKGFDHGLIAVLEGATLRGAGDTFELKVYHPEYTDADGDACSIACYEFYNLHLKSASSGKMVFEGVLVKIRHYGEEDIPVTGFSHEYIPEPVNEDCLPLSVMVFLKEKKV